MSGWYYKLFDAEFGPVSFDELVELAKSHSLSADDQIRFGDDGNWRRAGSMGQLMAHLPYQAPKAIPTAASPGSGSDSSWSNDSNDNDFETSVEIDPPKIEDRWWCNILGNEVGPMTFDELADLAKSQSMSRDDQVKFGESGRWRRAGSIGPLMAHFPFQAVERVIGRSSHQMSVVDDSAPSTTPTAARVAAAPSVPNNPVDSESVPAPATESVAPTIPAPASTDDRWWCLINDKEYGPVDLAKIQEWAAGGRLHAYDYLRMGINDYVLASEVPGLFPKRPDAVKRPGASGPAASSSMQSSQVAKPATDVAMSALSDTAPAMTPAQERTPSSYTPMKSSSATMSTMTSSSATMSTMSSSGFNMNTSGAARASVPMRRPMPSKSSGDGFDFMKLITGPIGMGVGGVLVLGAVIYFALPLITGGANAADTKRMVALQTEFNKLIEARGEGGKGKDVKAQADKLGKEAAKVLAELKGAKTPGGKSVASLAKALQEYAKKDVSKQSAADQEIGKKFTSARKALGGK